MSGIFISKLRSPHLNLAIETALFNTLKPNAFQLFLYVNDPCIVIGRNQNPWKECNVKAAREMHIPIIRRRSGGGTVVHDHGNINFCVQSPRTSFDRSIHIELLVNALQSKGCSLKINDRHDILNAQGEKVSGSSYKLVRLKAYHHATMLLNSDLPMLRKLLRKDPSSGIITGLGTESVSSPVANSGISRQVYIDTWVELFQKRYGPGLQVTYFDDSMITNAIEEDAEELRSWDWCFGEAPKFQHKIGGYEFEVTKGRITEGPAELIGSQYKNLGLPISKYIDP